MKNSISKIMIGIIILIIGVGIFICYNGIVNKEKVMHYKFENNKLWVSIYSDEWIEVPYDFSYTIEYLKETNNGQFRDGTYQMSDEKIVFYREQSYSKILNNEGNVVTELEQNYITCLVYSNDKGKTWEQVQIATTSSRDVLVSVNFESENNGKMTLKSKDGKEVHYYTTVDGGQEWETVGSDIIEETANTSRIFDKDPTVAVSNSNTEPGTCIYKAFNVLKTEELQIEEFSVRDELCFKKIISYNEYLKYKNMWSGIRELTKEDFFNYYLILIVDKNYNEKESYTFKRLLVENEYLNLNIAQREANTNEKKECIASGIAIIIPNRTDFKEDKINIVLDKEL